MRQWSMLLLIGVVGCGPQPMPCANTGAGGFGAAGPGTGGGFGAGGGNGAPQKLLGLAGKPVTVKLTVPQVVFCGPGSKVLDVATEVFDPSNHAVAHTHSEPKSTTVNTFGFEQAAFGVDVTFTPQSAGSHHLVARFEPSLGNAQLDVDVAADRTGAPSKTLSLGVTCAALETLPSGLVLCLKDDDVLVMFRDEMSLAQTIDADDFAVAGDKVWTARFGTVKRWVDVGGAAPLGRVLTHDTFIAERGTLVATEDAASYVTTNAVVRLKVGALSLVEEARVYPPLSAGWVLAPTANPAHLLIVTGGGFSGNAQMCSVVVAANANPDCGFFAATPLGADETGVWANSGGALSHFRWEGAVDGGSLSKRTIAFPGLPQIVPTQRHFASTPSFTVDGKNVVPKFTDADGIALEGYDLPSGYQMMPSSAKTVRAQTAGGMQRLITR